MRSVLEKRDDGEAWFLLGYVVIIGVVVASSAFPELIGVRGGPVESKSVPFCPWPISIPVRLRSSPLSISRLRPSSFRLPFLLMSLVKQLEIVGEGTSRASLRGEETVDTKPRVLFRCSPRRVVFDDFEALDDSGVGRGFG
jgi:hypothetical protein